jgi:Tol biopolymer transport system component
MNIDGSDPKQLTGGSRNTLPCLSPDGKWVVYQGFVAGRQTALKVSIDGGGAVGLTDKFAASPVVSPDGKLVACFLWDEQAEAKRALALLSIEGSPPVKTFDIPPTASELLWLPDGSALTYVVTRGGVSNIWRQPVDGGPPAPLTGFKSERIFHYDWSRDGRQLACTRGIITTDAVLISDFR